MHISPSEAQDGLRAVCHDINLEHISQLFTNAPLGADDATHTLKHSLAAMDPALIGVLLQNGADAFLVVTLTPAIGMALIPPENRDWPSALLGYFWLFLLGPTIQLLGVAAFIVQAERVRKGSDGALSIRGLTIQAAIYLLVSISFLDRYRVPPEEPDEHIIVNLRSWYWRFGWAMINNVVFAMAQGILA